MLDSKDKVQLVPTLISGNAKISMGFSEDQSDVFIKVNKATPISLKPD